MERSAVIAIIAIVHVSIEQENRLAKCNRSSIAFNTKGWRIRGVDNDTASAYTLASNALEIELPSRPSGLDLNVLPCGGKNGAWFDLTCVKQYLYEYAITLPSAEPTGASDPLWTYLIKGPSAGPAGSTNGETGYGKLVYPVRDRTPASCSLY